MAKKVYGIDLGTTYSAIAYVNDDGKAEIIENTIDEGSGGITPSVVYFETETNPVVGQVAKDSGWKPEEAERTVAFVKQDMANPKRSFEFFSKEYSPVDISALILERMIQDARDQGHDVQDVVITVPAYFDTAAKERTKQAGILAGETLQKKGGAGVNVLALTTEPTAAAVEYAVSVKNTEGKTVLVYDLGGGTFDVTVVQISGNNVIQVLGISGNPCLGGKDWDNRVFDYYIAKFKEHTGIDLRSDSSSNAKKTLLSVREMTEKVKKALTKKESTSGEVTFGTELVNLELSRQKFDEITKDCLAKTLPYVNQALEMAGKDSVDTVLLVGGSTKMPQVRAYINEQLHGKFKEIINFDPDKSVAKGAALFAEMKWIEKKREEGQSDAQIAQTLGKQTSEVRKTITVIEAAARSYGVGFYNPDRQANFVGNLILMGASLPAKESTIAHTTEPQQAVNMSIYESFVMDSESYEMANFTLLIEKEWKLGRVVEPTENIDEILTLSQDGLLTLSARIPGCPEFNLPFRLPGVYNDDEMRNKSNQLSQLNTSSTLQRKGN
jgi:molecular chaperone DnaK (HSP70)